MEKQEFNELLRRYQEGTCTDEELTLLESWYLFKDDDAIKELPPQEFENDLLAIRNQIQLTTKKKVHRLLPWVISAAASILVVFSIGFLMSRHEVANKSQLISQKHDVPPGRNEATLTLSNGKKVILNAVVKGKIAQQGNTTINVGNGLSYQTSTKNFAENDKPIYNTLSTARGQQSPYALVLQDGTKVWLNAGSSITYPVVFNSKNREVSITGEAYFEVVHNQTRPFRVIAEHQIIEDIGTHFDVSAYTDDRYSKTTLLEGSVSVSLNNDRVILKPGTQAKFSNGISNPKIKVINDADMEEAIAWKNGLFLFNDEPLESIMKKLSRWYDVEVVYQDINPEKAFWGGISRYSNISKVLEKLELTGGVHFTLAGRRVIVSK